MRRTTAKVTSNSQVGYLYKCCYCGNINIVHVTVREVGEAMTTYSPFSAEKKQQRNQELCDTAKSSAQEKLIRRVYHCDVDVNEHRNLNDLGFNTTCSSCGKKQVWSGLSEIRLRSVAIAAGVLLFVSMVLEGCMGMPENTAGIMNACGFFGLLIYVIGRGYKATGIQKAIDQLPVDFLPIALTEYNTQAILQSFQEGRKIPGVCESKNPRVNARNTWLNMIRCVCFIICIFCAEGYFLFWPEAEFLKYISAAFAAVFLILYVIHLHNVAFNGN